LYTRDAFALCLNKFLKSTEGILANKHNLLFASNSFSNASQVTLKCLKEGDVTFFKIGGKYPNNIQIFIVELQPLVSRLLLLEDLLAL
jgi:hypothetical protein